MLDDPEQRLLRRLALFETEFTLEAAEAACAFDGLLLDEIVYVLDRLVTQSLRVRVQGWRDDALLPVAAGAQVRARAAHTRRRVSVTFERA